MKKKLLIGFFIAMLLLTVLSRAVDSLVIPKVQVTTAVSSPLTYSVKGEGVIKAGETKYLDIPEGIKVDRVLASGQKVEAGQGVIFFRMSHLEEKKKELERDIQKQQLSLEREKLSGQTAASISSQERVAGDLKQANEGLLQANGDLAAAKEEYEQKENALKEKLARDEALAKQKLEIAKEEKKKGAETISGNVAVPNYDNEELAYEETMAALHDSYENLGEQILNSMKAAKQQQKDKQAALDAMNDTAALSKKEDAVKNQNDKTASEISEKNQEMIALDLDAQKEKLTKIEDLIAADGAVTADAAGVITKMEVTAGKITSGNELVEIGSGQPFFAGTMNEEGLELMEEGDEVNVLMPLETAAVKGSVNNISIQTKEEEAEVYLEFTAALSVAADKDYRIGSTAAFTMEKSTAMKYSCVIPLQALRQDSNGAYCLIAEKRDTILGQEDIAVRVPVEVLKKNKNRAAVNGVFTEKDRIITGSNKSIAEGDRVRVDE